MSTITTPSMSMVLPVPSSEPGPAWAQELLDALRLILDSHTHVAGKGLKIPVSGMDFSADVNVNNQKLTNLLRLIFISSVTDDGTGQNQLSTIGNGEAGWRDNDGVLTQLTNGGRLNVPNGIVGVKNVDYTITTADGISFLAVDSTAAIRNITLPLASANGGRRIVIKDQLGQAGTHVINVLRAGGDTIDGATSVVLNASFAKCIVFSDGTHWLREA